MTRPPRAESRQIRYYNRNRRLISARRRDHYRDVRESVILDGTAEDAARYGCLKEWRQRRGLEPTAHGRKELSPGDYRATFRINIIENGTEEEARRYGVLKRWRLRRGLPITDHDRLPPHEKKVKYASSVSTVKAQFVSLDKWKKNFFKQEGGRKRGNPRRRQPGVKSHHKK